MDERGGLPKRESFTDLADGRQNLPYSLCHRGAQDVLNLLVHERFVEKENSRRPWQRVWYEIRRGSGKENVLMRSWHPRCSLPFIELETCTINQQHLTAEYIALRQAPTIAQKIVK